MPASFSTPAGPALAGTGILLAASGSGVLAAVSAMVVPRLLEAPSSSLLLAQWQRTFARGKAVMPGLAAGAATSFFFAAAVVPRGVGGRRLFVLAGALCVAIVPYTWVVLMRTNRMLLARLAAVESDIKAAAAEGGEVVETEEERRSDKFLVDRWGLLSLGRAVLLAAGAAVGLGAAL
ncbi:hypothetical protein B0T26DRAFT_746749 [Lasiosphaeria miniovina]|uniref:DUF1772-domain-containing protein n=1 Tax=Lasiosphaeria miniovina TaxID=1954250 RepID=A0AA40BIL6_9PEZI|nr:uncharacterized protein B0T26DRAFT_746749 [Lasiosphaeria miniovina]KAK0734904.1 hypothetical protein B0T26DRAFT_746749 [Lasiosphaeria miniovina]